MLNSLFKVGLNTFKASLQEIDLNTTINGIKTRLDNISKDVAKEVKKISKHIHNYFDKWVVDIDYNQDEDTIASQLKDGILTVKVSNETNGSERSFTTSIPEDVISESLVQKYDSKNKKAIFIFTKKDVV